MEETYLLMVVAGILVGSLIRWTRWQRLKLAEDPETPWYAYWLTEWASNASAALLSLALIFLWTQGWILVAANYALTLGGLVPEGMRLNPLVAEPWTALAAGVAMDLLGKPFVLWVGNRFGWTGG